MKRIITLIIVAAGLVLVGPAAASAKCHRIMTTPGYHDAYTNTIDVRVHRYLGMSCARALRVAAAAYIKPLHHLTYYPGGFMRGGSFHLGHLYCQIDARGSDFRNGACWHGHWPHREYVKFYDHRNY